MNEKVLIALYKIANGADDPDATTIGVPGPNNKYVKYVNDPKRTLLKSETRVKEPVGERRVTDPKSMIESPTMGYRSLADAKRAGDVDAIGNVTNTGLLRARTKQINTYLRSKGLPVGSREWLEASKYLQSRGALNNKAYKEETDAISTPAPAMFNNSDSKISGEELRRFGNFVTKRVPGSETYATQIG